MTETMNRTLVTEACAIKDFTVITFMNPTYFDLEKSYHDEVSGMYCFVVDKQKFGVMTEQQMKDAQTVLKHFIPHGYQINEIDGMNTTLLFEMDDSEGFDPAKEVNECIYDLNNSMILTRQIRWDTKHPFNAGTERFPDEAWEGRKKLYTEWERIGKTLFAK